MIRFSCPNCQRSFQCPKTSAGTKFICSCGQRIQIPEAPKPPLNKTVLGRLPGEQSVPDWVKEVNEFRPAPPLPPPEVLPAVELDDKERPVSRKRGATEGRRGRCARTTSPRPPRRD